MAVNTLVPFVEGQLVAPLDAADGYRYTDSIASILTAAIGASSALPTASPLAVVPTAGLSFNIGGIGQHVIVGGVVSDSCPQQPFTCAATTPLPRIDLVAIRPNRVQGASTIARTVRPDSALAPVFSGSCTLVAGTGTITLPAGLSAIPLLAAPNATTVGSGVLNASASLTTITITSSNSADTRAVNIVAFLAAADTSGSAATLGLLENQVQYTVVTGTPAASPAVPSPPTGYISFASILIPGNATTLGAINYLIPTLPALSLNLALTTVATTGSATIGGPATIAGTLTATGAATIGTTLTVTGLATIGGSLGVIGQLTTNASLIAVGPVTCQSTLGATGNVVFLGTLTVYGNTSLGGTLAVAANTDVAGHVTVGTTLGVTGAATVATLGVVGNTTVGGTLGVTGLATISGTLSVTGSATVGSLTATGGSSTTGGTTTDTLTVSSTLGVTGAATLSGALNVTGVATFSNVINANGGVAATTLSATGAITATSAAIGALVQAGAGIVSVAVAGGIQLSTHNIVKGQTFTTTTGSFTLPTLPGGGGVSYTVRALFFTSFSTGSQNATLTGGSGATWSPSSVTTGNGNGTQGIAALTGTATGGQTPSVSWSQSSSLGTVPGYVEITAFTS